MSELLNEYLHLVAEERERTLVEHGDDYENGKEPNLLMTIVAKEFGVMSACALEEANRDYGDAMLDIQRQCVVVGGLLASLYELAERHRLDYLDELGELTEDIGLE